MAVPTSRSGRMTELQPNKLWRDHHQQQLSPDRNVVWTEPPKPDRKVPVLYYLSRNGQLQHPHFMEVPLSSSRGLFLSDVINRLNALRGNGMASLYSWSCKRNYKNGYVWHDLSENDLIYPAHGHEYILKGSEILDSVLQSPSLLPPPDSIQRTPEDNVDTRRRNQSCSSIDFNSLDEYGIYKSNASTQTDDNRYHRRPRPEIVDEEKRDEIEISPPPSDSSSNPETLDTLMKVDGQALMVRQENRTNEDLMVFDEPTQKNCGGGGKSASVLMQLISCGHLISFKDCGVGQGIGFIGQYKTRTTTRGGASGESGRVKLSNSEEEKEYVSGRLVETTKNKLEGLVVSTGKVNNPAGAGGLKRSTSYNADRSSQLELIILPFMEIEKEIEGLRAKCEPT